MKEDASERALIGEAHERNKDSFLLKGQFQVTVPNPSSGSQCLNLNCPIRKEAYKYVYKYKTVSEDILYMCECSLQHLSVDRKCFISKPQEPSRPQRSKEVFSFFRR